MRKVLIILFVVIVGYKLQAQTQSDSLSFKEAVEIIESEKNIAFFFRSEWTENIKVARNQVVTSGEIEEIILRLVENTQLNYYLSDNQVFLLDNVSVVVPQIYDEEITEEEVENNIVDNLIFQSTKKQGNAENIIHAVGDIKKFTKGREQTIKGVVRSEDGPIDGVYIFTVEPFTSAISDKEGNYSLTLPSGRNEINFQSVTTIATKRKVNLYSDGSLDVFLDTDVVALEEVIVNAQREKNTTSTQMGMVSIDPKEVEIVPAFLGERDIIKVATSTAGVQNVGEGSAGINIRGGKADQNLFLIDNNTVFTTNHFFGFFSAFNSRGVGGLSLYKNGIPAEYGGRLSSVFDIKTIEPNSERWEVSGGVGIVTSQVQVEGPLDKGKTSILVNARGTYSQYVLDQFKNSSIGNNSAAFYDFTAKTFTKLSDKDEISLTGYYSYDAFKIKSDTLLSFSNFSYENFIVGGSWKHVFNDNLFGILEIGNSNFSYLSSYDILPSQAFNVDLFVNEFRAAAKFDYFVNEKINYKFGLETKSYNLNPGEKSPKGDSSLIALEKIDDEKAFELAPYASISYNHSDRLSFDGGIRYSIFNVLGPATVNEYEPGSPKQSSSLIGVKEYGKGDVVARNHGPEFRLQGRYSLKSSATSSTSIKASYNRTRQNVHLLLNSASIAPTDVWRLSSPFIKPQLADQISVGLFKNFFDEHLIEASVEIYHKRIQNLLDFKTGAELQFNPAIETDLLQGDGKSYGMEVSLKKTGGWLTGWLNYTYSRSFIKLAGNNPSEIINGGEFFPTGYDKPHYFNSVTNYKFTRRLTMTLNMVYSSGIPVTFPVGKWDFKNSENILYSERNEFRIPNYFRLDLGFNVNASHKLKKFTHSSWTFSVYNLLGRDNIYSVFFEVEDEEVKGYKMSIFPKPIPTITYNFRF